MQGNNNARLRSNEQYREVLKCGRSVANSLAVLYVLPKNGQGLLVPRFGISVPRRFGTAVARNRVRRLFWEAYRLEADHLRGGIDLVLIPRFGARGKGFQECSAALKGLLVRLEAYREGMAP